MDHEEQLSRAGVPAAEAAARASVVRQLEGYGAREILRQLAVDGQLVDVRCEMPQCYCPKGRSYFEPISPHADWSPTADHYPQLKMHKGRLAPENVRLGHRVCNQRDYLWRTRINKMLAQRMSLQQIADELNAKKIPPIHGTNSWTAASVRKAFVS
jgi:Recombinase